VSVSLVGHNREPRKSLGVKGAYNVTSFSGTTSEEKDDITATTTGELVGGVAGLTYLDRRKSKGGSEECKTEQCKSHDDGLDKGRDMIVLNDISCGVRILGCLNSLMVETYSSRLLSSL
jgi:hypothetical protein